MTDQPSQSNQTQDSLAKRTKQTSKPQKLSERDLIDKVVETTIIESGWHSNGILKEPKISLHGLRLVPDFVLLHEWYPLTVVEVKREGRLIASRGIEQAKHYAKVVGLPLAIATDGTKCLIFNLETGLTQSWEKFPSPQDLWQCLGRNLDTTDPRLYPVTPNSRPPKLHQALALSRALDALVSGVKRGIISMAQGSGSNYVIAQLVYKLIHSGFYQRLIYLSQHQEDLGSLLQALRDNQETVSIMNQYSGLESSSQINLFTPLSLVELKNLLDSSQKSSNFYDLILTRNPSGIDELISSLDYLSQTTILGLTFSDWKGRKLSNFPDKPIFEYSLQDFIIDISPPEGFTTVLLGDISEISLGIRLNKNSHILIEDTGNLQPEQAYLLAARDILDNGNINFNDSRRIRLQDLSEQTSKNKNSERYFAQSGDILMSSISSHTHKRLAIVQDDVEGTIAFSDSVIRIRVDKTKAKASDIFNFLISDSGQNLVQRFALSMAGMARYSPISLAETPIFIPEKEGANNADKLSNTALVIRQLRDEILPSLEKSEEFSETANVEKIDFEVIAQQLHKIANFLAPLPLAERVINKYPTPIALAYRRFHDSKFNVYEQVQRLLDVYESASFFVYNLVLADIFRRLDPKKFFIIDARRAYGGYSMAARIELVKKVINIARLNSNNDIFIPELVDSPFAECAEELKDLRNILSHTATVTESMQKQNLSKYQPIVEKLLSGLEFLEDYRLVRVPSFYRKGGQFIYRMEVYQGTVPYLDEQAANEDSALEELKEAEYNHLIMLNNYGKILDLHPLYQLVENKETQYESHICFFKQRKAEAKKLEGESVVNSKIVDLEGFDAFETLQSKILTQPPGDER